MYFENTVVYLKLKKYLSQKEKITEDEKFMARAISLASLGEGHVSPNPLVGAVIVRDGNVIGEGFHTKCGNPHAEIEAFRNMEKNGYCADGATMYVTLEPCSHFGKTPPCCDEIVRRKLKRVVISIKDPNPLVAGRGIERIEKAGIEVETGVLDDITEFQNEVFLKYISEKKPFTVLKTATTLDGKIATYSGKSKWITNGKSRGMVHSMRNRYSAILVGINTLLKDNPRLNTRLSEDILNELEEKNMGSSDCIKVVLDSKGRIPVDSNLVKSLEDDKNSGLVLASTSLIDSEKKKILEEKGVKVLVLESDENGRPDIEQLLDELGKLEIDSLMIEGGGEVNFSFLEKKLVDRVFCFVAPKMLGGRNALTSVEGNGFYDVGEAVEYRDIEHYSVGDDVLITGKVK